MNVDQVITGFQTLSDLDQGRVAKAIRKIRNDNFVLTKVPNVVKVGDVRGWLGNPDLPENKENIIKFIEARLSRRYIRPLKDVPLGSRSGFLIMAASCLLIETLQQFYSGEDETKGQHVDVFRKYFEKEKALFEDCAINSRAFYNKIRCGLLHQAETKGGYRILFNDGRLFDASERRVNATMFLETMEKCVASYLIRLRQSGENNECWKNALKKVKFICDNCQATD